MAEIAQEESSAPVKAVAVEVETEVEAPVVATEAPSAPVAAEPLKEVVAEVKEATGTRAKRTLKNVTDKVAAEVKAVEEKVKFTIAAEEHNVVLKMENEFLKVTTQITQLQAQAQTIQKNFPEYLKTLAAKYGVDLTKYNFNAIEGTFNKL